MATHHYNLADCSLTVCGYGPVNDLATGDSVTISFSEDDWAVIQGHGGVILRSRKPNALATAEISIVYGSPVNDVLSQIAATDRATGLGTGVFQFSDTNGSSVASAQTSWIVKMPDMVGKTEQDSVSWSIQLAGAEIHLGANRLA